jgi:hypothetical protein
VSGPSWTDPGEIIGALANACEVVLFPYGAYQLSSAPTDSRQEAVAAFGRQTGRAVPETEEPLPTPLDGQLRRFPGDQRGRVSLVLDGRRVLENFTAEEAAEVLAVVVRCRAERKAAAAGVPGAGRPPSGPRTMRLYPWHKTPSDPDLRDRP